MERKRRTVERTGLVAAVCLFLVAAIPTAGNEENDAGRRRYEGQDELRKLVSVVKTGKAPSIDGIMEDREWENAAAITGLGKTTGNWLQAGTWGLENMADVQSTFWITYDDRNLYIAHHSPPPPNIKDSPQIVAVMLKQIITQHDSNVERDDCIGMTLVHPEYPGGDLYVLLVNPLGTTFDCIFGGGHNYEGITVGWDPRFEKVSRLTPDGWTVEVAIPWAEFGPHVHTPAAGESLRMNFIRAWREVTDETHAWAATDFLDSGLPYYLKPAGEVRFQGDAGIVVQLKDIGNLPAGRATIVAEIRNVSATPRTVTAAVRTNSGELSEDQDLSLAGGAGSTFTFAGTIADLATTTLTFQVTDADSGEAFHVTTLPVIRPTEAGLVVRRYRSRELSAIEADLSFLGAVDPGKIRIDMTLRNQETGTVALTKEFSGFSSLQPTLEFSTEKLQPGDYTAAFVFRVPGRTTAETAIDYRHPELPVWWNNTYGCRDMELDKVPYPWTDMQVEDDAVHVWGRAYRFGNRLLPDQITTLGQPMLRGPVRVRLRTAAGEVVDTATAVAEGRWTRRDKTRVEGERRVSAESLALRNSCWAEYDGLVWNRLTIEPKDKVTIAAMELEIPLTEAFTDVMNGIDYSLRTTGKIPEKGFADEPTRRVWLGNAEGGIQWFCETNGWFFVEEMDEALRVDLQDGAATLRVTMIDTPTKFDAPHTIEFGFIATPVRPKLTRLPSFCPRSVTGGGPWYPRDGLEFMPAADPGHNFYNSGRIYVHVGPVNIEPKGDAAGADDALFSDEWLANPHERSARASITQSSRTLRDYFVWRHWRYQRKYGYSGLYYDGAAPMPSTNPYANAGHRRKDGREFPTVPLLGARDIVKRMYNITLSYQYLGAREQAIGFHESAMPNMSYMGFGTYHWDAENYNSIINRQQPTYIGFTDPAKWRAQHMMFNMAGIPTFFLGQGRIKREWLEPNGGTEAVFDHIYGLNLLHDGNGVCCILPGITRELQYRRQADVAKLYLRDWVYQFTPYWNQTIVQLPREELYASFFIARPSTLFPGIESGSSLARNRTIAHYIHGFNHLPDHIKRRCYQEAVEQKRWLRMREDRAVLVLYNNSEWAGELRLAVDWKKLGLGAPEDLTATNYLHSTGFRLETARNNQGEEVEKAVFFDRPEEFARIENGELVFPMTRFNYRMIVLEKRP